MHPLGCSPGTDPFFGDAPVSFEAWHFTGNSTGREGWQTTTVDTGAAAYLNPGDPALPGAMELEVTAIGGPSGNDQAAFTRLVGGVFGFGATSPRARFRRIIQHGDAPDGTDDYGMRIGLMNGLSYTGTSVWIALEAQFGLYGANWQLTTRDGGGISNVDTGIPVASTAGAPLPVEFRLLAGGTGIVLALSGADVALQATVPATVTMSSSFQTLKVSGANARVLLCDYASEEFELPAAFG